VGVHDGFTLNIYGLECTHDPNHDARLLENLLSTNPIEDSPGFNLLLYHSPDIAPTVAQLGFDLQLSGHTHGGQVRLPLFGALITGSLYRKKFEAGRYSVGPMELYVSRGIGLEGGGAPRVRFLCPPEVILWEIIN
jgi:predicted MPP superfamily phosphohydrolase